MAARIMLAACLLALGCGSAWAAEADLAPLQCGEDEREDAPAPCLQEDAFLGGTVSTAANLLCGGTAYGCNAEYAASMEFDLQWLPPQHDVLQAVLTVRKTGYADDAQGFFYLGVFPYPADGAPVAVPREDLNPDTALAIIYPPAANVDMVFDATAAVQEAAAMERSRVGFLLAGIFSEAGYEDYVTVGGSTHPNPPRLVVQYEGAVPVVPAGWSQVKALYR